MPKRRDSISRILNPPRRRDAPLTSPARHLRKDGSAVRKYAPLASPLRRSSLKPPPFSAGFDDETTEPAYRQERSYRSGPVLNLSGLIRALAFLKRFRAYQQAKREQFAAANPQNIIQSRPAHPTTGMAWWQWLTLIFLSMLAFFICSCAALAALGWMLK